MAALVYLQATHTLTIEVYSQLSSKCDMKLHFVLEMFLVLQCTFHVVLHPYTKEDESFNLNAVHDILYHGTDSDLDKVRCNHTRIDLSMSSYYFSLRLRQRMNGTWKMCLSAYCILL